MTAPHRIPSLAVQASVAASLVPWAGKPHPQSFADEIRETAKQISADIAAGRQVVTEHGVFTPAELEQRVLIDGGYLYLSRSVGVDTSRDDAVLQERGL
jgi:hypothetical protein